MTPEYDLLREQETLRKGLDTRSLSYYNGRQQSYYRRYAVYVDPDGQMYLSLHSPNAAEGNRKERPVFLAIEEKDEKLIRAESERKKS